MDDVILVAQLNLLLTIQLTVAICFSTLMYYFLNWFMPIFFKKINQFNLALINFFKGQKS